MPSKSQYFRQLVEAEETLIQPGIYGRFGARLVQQTGFEPGSVAGLTGFGSIKDMEQRRLTAAQRRAKYGAAAV